MGSIISADDFFTDAEGNYKYDPSKIGQAHNECLRRFINFMNMTQTSRAQRVVVMRGIPGSGKSTWAKRFQDLYDMCVDNTNTAISEIAPYAAIAQAYGHSLAIVCIRAKPEFAAARNSHGVSPITVGMMHQRMTTERVPPWWRTIDVADFETDVPRADMSKKLWGAS